jgi:hypothetical protein
MAILLAHDSTSLHRGYGATELCCINATGVMDAFRFNIGSLDAMQ